MTNSNVENSFLPPSLQFAISLTKKSISKHNHCARSRKLFMEFLAWGQDNLQDPSKKCANCMASTKGIFG